MKTSHSRVIADGPQRLREAKNYSEMRKLLLAEFAQHHEEERKAASFWRRLWIDVKIHCEVRAELARQFPSGALHIAPVMK